MNSPDQTPENDSSDARDPAGASGPTRGRNARLMRPPRRLHGARTPCLSPLALYGMVHEERPVPNEAQRQLFLTERTVDRVDARGIVLGGEYFTSPELAPYTTRSAAEPSPNLVVRRDEALFSRGILDEAYLYEVEEGDTRRFICKLVFREDPSQVLDPEMVWRNGQRHVHQLGKERDAMEDQFLELQVGTKRAKKLLAQQDARRQRNARERPDPHPAEPIGATSDEAEALTNLQQQLQEDRQQAEEEQEEPFEEQDAADARKSMQQRLRNQHQANEQGEDSD